ncbi:DUF3634 family protein [Thaumasiovibrio subtropicus]|uniref:DUF3634 family protein n=1 Tax=Thaumasiovibrio subtropicus TaxID=1891207 RepID=UPI000B363C7E|nr:DUF3634 family protein [Thaumasiovibrio subtropicus]
MLYVLLLAIAVCVFVFIDRPIIAMWFKDGDITKSKGNIPHGFLHDCKEIGHKQPFSGSIKVYKNRFTTKLVFSKSVPAKVKQRIRNVFPHQAKLKARK